MTCAEATLAATSSRPAAALRNCLRVSSRVCASITFWPTRVSIRFTSDSQRSKSACTRDCPALTSSTVASAAWTTSAATVTLDFDCSISASATATAAAFASASRSNSGMAMTARSSPAATGSPRSLVSRLT